MNSEHILGLQQKVIWHSDSNKSLFLSDVDPYCEDKMPKDCMRLVTRDKESCKTKPEFMKENCGRTCGYCGKHDEYS